MALAPDHVRIRNYNVGFGDCFLLTFRYPGAVPRNVLIDFGSTKGAPEGPKGGLRAIADQIRKDCRENGGGLDVVVATHRHADHISGFAGEPGRIIRALKPEVVVQPWTEDPDLDPKARAPAVPVPGGPRRAQAAVVSRLADMQALAGAIANEAPSLAASGQLAHGIADQLRFLGETNLSNAESVRNLMQMGRRKPIYASFGTDLALNDLLPGIGVHVLGPPTLDDSPEIIRQAEKHAEFWHLGARRAAAGNTAGRASRRLFPGAPVAGSRSQEARWVIPKIDELRGEEMLAIVRILDDALNNTSLILLFEIGPTLLLFPGDAQIENWLHALEKHPGARRTRAMLARTSFYKVGHHGSLNATPKTKLWRRFKNRSADDAAPTRLKTMVSTADAGHGSTDDDTEVPRRTLLAELARMSDFQNTQDITSRTTFWNDAELEL